MARGERNGAPLPGEERFYRAWAVGAGLSRFDVVVAETDLQIFAEQPLTDETNAAVRRARRDVEFYAATHDGFLVSLKPVTADPGAPEIVKRMCSAGAQYGVGPMAAVAGAVADFVGRELLRHSRQVIVENGGDVFFQTDEPPICGLYVGEHSPFTGRVRFRPLEMDYGGVCTSSGTVGHSLSFGQADGVVIVARDPILADAAATAICNSVHTEADVALAIEREKESGLVDGGLIAIGTTLGAWGSVEIIEGG